MRELALAVIRAKGLDEGEGCASQGRRFPHRAGYADAGKARARCWGRETERGQGVAGA